MFRVLRLLPLAAVFVAAAAAAQSLPTGAAGADSAAPDATLSYRPPLAGYQPFSDEKVLSWKDANDNVGRIGGWREYARESQQTETASPAPAAPTGTAPAGTPASPAGHGGHANH